MTISELLVFNSTIASGTVLDHLTNIATERQVFKGIDVNIDSTVHFSITSDIISANITDHIVSANITDGSEVNLVDTKLGVNI